MNSDLYIGLRWDEEIGEERLMFAKGSEEEARERLAFWTGKGYDGIRLYRASEIETTG